MTAPPFGLLPIPPCRKPTIKHTDPNTGDGVTIQSWRQFLDGKPAKVRRFCARWLYTITKFDACNWLIAVSTKSIDPAPGALPRASTVPPCPSLFNALMMSATEW